MPSQKKIVAVVVLLSCLIFSPSIGSAADEMSCTDLAEQILADPNILSATSVISGTTNPYCLVNLTQYQAINIRVGLPLNVVDGGTGGIQGAWNGKVQNSGGGGFAGSVGSVASAASNRYVMSSCDTGHSRAWCNEINPDTGEPNSLPNCGSSGAGFVIDGDGNLIDWQVTDFITDSIYAQVTWALDIADLYYGRKPDRNYWSSCSTGGRQGFEMAQKYGDLFDGLLVGAPAMNWNRFQTAELWPPVVVRSLGLPGTPPTLSTVKSNAAIAAAVAACSEYGDGVLNEPRRCNFDARTLICPDDGSNPPNCLTPEEADAINMIWYGPTNPQGYRLWGGPSIGTSFGTMLPGGNRAFGFMYDYERYWVHQDPDWPWESLAGEDFEEKFTEEFRFQDQKFQETASTDSTDLHKIIDRGAKIIHYHGISDPLIIPFGSYNYVSRVFDRYGVAETQTFMRSFFLPNQGHCGTAGISFFDALVNWVENGVAPDYFNGNVGSMANPRYRKICKYPDEAVYNGEGLDNYDNFTCQVNETEPADLWEHSNLGPIVLCKDVEVSASPTECSVATASVDNGSSDRYGDPIELVQDSTGPFYLGSTVVKLTGTDSRNAVSSCEATVTVVDTTPPSISSVTASPDVLWPPNHKMVPVAVDLSVTDACDENAADGCMIVSVASNEPIDGPGDGNTEPDYEITGDLTLNLRAERSGTKNGRIYMVTVACTDASGNSSSNTVEVTVPHDQSKK
ncbi:MAG: tannase/feruloyl esterase family alpha/beta hydrolase [Desulfatiglandales bacterium]